MHMGVEQRNGRGLYYYRKKRIGKRVVSVYAGSGENIVASELRLAASRHAARKRLAQRAELQQIDEADAVCSAVCDLLFSLARRLLAKEGIYSHRGSWRRKRADES